VKRSGFAILVIALGAAALVSGRTDGPAAGAEKRGLENAAPLPVSPPAAENGEFIRGVWLHPGLFGPEESAAAAKMSATFESYVRAGIDSVFILVKSTSGHVYFRSTAGVADPAYTYDFFGVFLREARRRNLTVHPWFCVFTESAGVGEIGQHPEWLVHGPTGVTAGAVNPAIPEARAYERGLMMDLLRNYPEAGWIHLDYIRYPCEPAEPFYGFDERSRALFKAETGADPLELKAKDTGNMMWAEWLRWNGRQVTLFIQELREGLKSLGRPVRISAAVFPAADAAKIMIGQDWAEWVRTDLIDMLCPMLYTNSAALFETYAREAIALRTDRCRICLGIGIETSHNRNTPEGIAGQVKFSREAGADGVIFFSGSSLGELFLKRLEADRR
jgi:uncharacterized lipoprotein YddW (UPF0748 family)